MNFLRCAIFSAALLNSSFLFATDSDNGDTGGTYPQIGNDQNLDFAELSQIAQASGSLPATLQNLFQTKAEYLRFHTLMYSSFSLQESSFENPRAIVFGPQAHFVFTFNGNERMRGGNALETMEYSEAQNSFLFREITFKTSDFDRSETGLEEREVAYEDNHLLISTANPGKCTQCHGAYANPIWSTYFIWPGAYGSNFNMLYLNFDRADLPMDYLAVYLKGRTEPLSQIPPVSLSPKTKDAEVLGYISYLKQKPGHPRYRWLPEAPNESGFRRYAAGERLHTIDLGPVYRAERKRVNGGRLWPGRPNQFFQVYLMHQNQKRILHDLVAAGFIQNELRGPRWDGLAKPAKSLRQVASRIVRLLALYRLHGPRPTTPQVEAMLRAHLTNEIGMQRERLTNQRDNFGLDSLRFFPAQQEFAHQRYGLDWTTDALGFYTDLLNLNHVSKTDRIAFKTDSDNHAVLLALKILLADRGVDLLKYNMNIRQQSLAFYLDGLREVAEFLGIDPRVLKNI